MRIGFLGKGGSGKTSLSAGYVHYLLRHVGVNHLLAIDADVNVHFQDTLGIAGDATALSNHTSEIKEYLRGKRTDLAGREMLATTHPSLHSQFVLVDPKDSLLQRYALQTDQISLLTVGTYETKDVGNACYHGKLNSIEYVYHHLLDGVDDFVVADATAGIDNMATSLYLVYDLNVFVVEPTLRSIRVYLDFAERVADFGIKAKVVLNKLMSKEDEEFVQEHIDAENIIGGVPFSQIFRDLDRGRTEALSSIVSEYEPVFAAIHQEVLAIEKRWDVYLARLKESHRQQAQKWYNGYFGSSLESGLDPEFSYEDVLRQNGIAV